MPVTKSLNQLKRADLVTEPSLLNCPADKAGEEKQYGFVYPAKGDETAADAVIAYDPTPHKDGTRNVLFFQGRVESMEEGDFRKALAASGGKLNTAAQRARAVKARADTKDGKVVVTIRAKVVDLKVETIDGKERVKARVIASVTLAGDASDRPIESGVRVVAGEPSADGTDVEIIVTLPTSDPGEIESLALRVDDRIAGETSEFVLEGKNVERQK